jgi:hypothetical protein
MKKKEVLIVFVLAVLATGLGCLLIPVQCLEVCAGWPFVVYESVVGWSGDEMTNILWANLALDFLFWFLVLAGGWWVVKKLKGGKMEVGVS